MANELKQAWGASETTVLSITADVTDGSLDAGTQTQLDNSSELYPYAKATIYLPNGVTGGAWNGTPTVDLYMEEQDIGGGTDDETPVLPSGGTDTVGLKQVGSFVLDDNATASTAQRRTCVFSLLGVNKAEFRIVNNTGRTLDYVATAITVKVRPFSVAPT